MEGGSMNMANKCFKCIYVNVCPKELPCKDCITIDGQPMYEYKHVNDCYGCHYQDYNPPSTRCNTCIRKFTDKYISR